MCIKLFSTINIIIKSLIFNYSFKRQKNNYEFKSNVLQLDISVSSRGSKGQGKRKN